MIKNAATGKCLQGTDNGTKEAHEVKMVPCKRSNQAIWWGLTAGRIMMVRTGGSASQVCLSIPISPKGDFAHDVVTARCGDRDYNQFFNTIRGTSIIGSPEPCLVGHYSSSDTWAACYVSSGNNTKWTWLS
ncbi:ricin-type beta-trefoil lectin domain protein [Streptomyces sp. NPDC058122]|uniref:ricin-type beta-trefoil lectin domain protein n=1 Tax=Streptomyces sp. NPDC058122 TaxID=3346349 RepID=UPI0036EC8A6D